MIFLTKEYWSNINEAHTRNKGICFENLVKKLLNAEYGNAVFQETRESWDGSRDFYYYSQQRKYWAECKNYASNIDLKVLASTLIMAQLSEIDTILYYSYSAINVNTKAKLLFNASREEKPSIFMMTQYLNRKYFNIGILLEKNFFQNLQKRIYSLKNQNIILKLNVYCMEIL